MASPKTDAAAQPGDAASRLRYVRSGPDAYTRALRLMEVLRAPGGCPWDIEQTPQTLRKYVLEEAYEVVDAIDNGTPGDLREELGDFFLQAVFLSQIAHERGEFDMDGVCDAMVDKMVERHPHVFAAGKAESANDVLQAWEQRRQQKKRDNFGGGIPASMPALARAQALSDRAARLGFDWRDHTELRGHLDAEWRELDAALVTDDQSAIMEEAGDVIFLLVNLCRQRGVDAEEAVRRAGDKFASRMKSVLRTVGDAPPPRVREPKLWDDAWDEAKAHELRDPPAVKIA